jgi:GDP-4-dehydro-6-deoxy-D-mannose reductase
VRDVGDVRDFVRAYLAALEHGAPGETYNVATGTGRRLGDILDALVARSSIGISVRVDPALMRPADPPVLTGSAAKLEKISGWRPRIPLEDTLAGMLEGWRSATRTEVALQGKLP